MRTSWTSQDAVERQRCQERYTRQVHQLMLERDAAERRAADAGLRNQRLHELTIALRGLNSDERRGLDPAQAAERVIGILESMVED